METNEPHDETVIMLRKRSAKERLAYITGVDYGIRLTLDMFAGGTLSQEKAYALLDELERTLKEVEKNNENS